VPCPPPDAHNLSLSSPSKHATSVSTSSALLFLAVSNGCDLPNALLANDHEPWKTLVFQNFGVNLSSIFNRALGLTCSYTIKNLRFPGKKGALRGLHPFRIVILANNFRLANRNSGRILSQESSPPLDGKLSLVINSYL